MKGVIFSGRRKLARVLGRVLHGHRPRVSASTYAGRPGPSGGWQDAEVLPAVSPLGAALRTWLPLWDGRLVRDQASQARPLQEAEELLPPGYRRRWSGGPG